MKVLIVNEKHPPYISGGAERSVQILAEERPTRRGPLSDFAPKTQTGVLHLFGLSDVHVAPGYADVR